MKGSQLVEMSEIADIHLPNDFDFIFAIVYTRLLRKKRLSLTHRVDWLRTKHRAVGKISSLWAGSDCCAYLAWCPVSVLRRIPTKPLLPQLHSMCLWATGPDECCQTPNWQNVVLHKCIIVQKVNLNYTPSETLISQLKGSRFCVFLKLNNGD